MKMRRDEDEKGEEGDGKVLDRSGERARPIEATLAWWYTWWCKQNALQLVKCIYSICVYVLCHQASADPHPPVVGSRKKTGKTK